MNKRFYILFFTLLSLNALFSRSIGLFGDYIQRNKELQKKETEKSGFANAEVDYLHRSIEKRLPFLAKKLEQDNQGEYYHLIPVASGESIKTISSRYLYNGDARFYTDQESKRLKKVVLSFVRLNPLGQVYLEEKREIINETPFFYPDPKTLDRNDDIILIYFEKGSWERSTFEEKYRYSLKNMRYFDKKIHLLNAYIQYLRRALKIINKEIYALELSERKKIQYTLEFQ